MPSSMVQAKPSDSNGEPFVARVELENFLAIKSNDEILPKNERVIKHIERTYQQLDPHTGERLIVKLAEEHRRQSWKTKKAAENTKVKSGKGTGPLKKIKKLSRKHVKGGPQVQEETKETRKISEREQDDLILCIMDCGWGMPVSTRVAEATEELKQALEKQRDVFKSLKYKEEQKKAFEQNAKHWVLKQQLSAKRKNETF